MTMVSSKREEVADADVDATQALNESVVSALEMCAIEESSSEDSNAGAGWARRVGTRLAAQLQALDTQNVAAMLAAATDGGGARLAHHLDAGATSANALATRLSRYEAICRGAAGCGGRGAAARADSAARALLTQLQELYAVLDSPPLQNLDDLSKINLATTEGSNRARSAADALIAAFNAEKTLPVHLKRLAAVRERIKRLHRAKESLCTSISHQLNNVLIHAGAASSASPRHHAVLLPHAPHMNTLKKLDRKAYDALSKVYTSTWCRLYGREVHAACEAALAQPPPHTALTQVLTLVEEVCNAEQDFCTQFFHLDEDIKEEGSDADSGSAGGGSRGAGAGGAGAGAEGKALQRALFPALEAELLNLVAGLDKADPHGCFLTFACISSRAVSGMAGTGTGAGTGAGTDDARWSRTALAAAAVSAKRAADRALHNKADSLHEHVKQAGRKSKCGVFPFIWELERLSSACEASFVSRRAELERWYHTLAAAMLAAIAAATHPRTPTHVLHMENYHALHSVLSSLRVSSLDGLRRECKSRYTEALRAYVAQYTLQPLDKLSHFFEGVSEAISSGVREEEVCYRAAFSKHELRRVLALYPAQEVRKSLRRLYRTVERHVSEEGGLLQVVWRAMQEELVAHHLALQARIAACYPGAGLSLPLTTDDILQAFSDIAREH